MDSRTPQIDEPAHDRADLRSALYLFNRFCRPYLKALLVLAVINVGTGFLMGLQPLLIAPAFTSVLGGSEQPAASLSAVTLNNIGPTLVAWLHMGGRSKSAVVLAVVAAYVAVTVVIAAAGSLAFVVSARIRSRILRDMIVALHRHVLDLPFAFLQKRRTGDLISRFTSDTAATAASLDSVMRGMIQSPIQIAISMFLLLRTDVPLSLCALGIGSVHFLITRMLSGWVRRRTTAVYDFTARMTATLQESFQSIRITKSLAAEDFDAGRVREATDRVQESFFRFRISRYAEEPVRLVADALVIGAMLVLAFYAMAHERLSMAGFAMFMVLARQVIAPLSAFAKDVLALHGMLGGARRVLEIFHTRSDMVDGRAEAPAFRSAIRVEGADFSYVPGHPVLRGLNLEVRKGQMVAIVGPSGAGKSTLTDIVLRLYDPLAGRVTYDGTDIREFRQESYRRRFGVVSQECLLLNTSIRDNVAYGRPMDEERIAWALRVANAYEFAVNLPAGLDTEVGDRGVRLSGGQRQRIAIARAVYGRPEILVLDEATSSLDSESEQAVQAAIDNVVREITAIVIAHRLSTVLHADAVVVLNDGAVEAVGRHTELLERSPTYARLYRLQFRGGLEDGPPTGQAGARS